MSLQVRALLLTLVCCASESPAQYTALSGYYDYQTNGRSAKYLRYNPANGHLHAILMTSEDSINYAQNRGTYYGYSTNGGGIWNTFNNLRVPTRSSWFPSLALGRGSIDGGVCIINQSSAPTGDAAIIHIDYPEGGGAFAELSPLPFRGDAPYSPDLACGGDGSIISIGVLPGSQTVAVSRTVDFLSWSLPTAIPNSSAVGDKFVVEANLQRVGVVFDGGPQGLCLWESTNNGVTWPAFTTQILPEHFPVGADTFALGPGLDLAYQGNTPLVIFGIRQVNSTTDHAGIGFWSPPTGFVHAVPHASIPGVANRLNRPQVNHLTVGYPSIGTISGYPSLYVAFQAFSPETSASGFNYSKVFVAIGANGGLAWIPPFGPWTPAGTDERYPSVSKMNSNVRRGIACQQDPEPGSFAAGDNTLIRRVRQRYFLLPIPSVDDPLMGVRHYSLGQNYPNPFNPSTAIEYQLPERSFVLLKVFDVLGREVATLVNEHKEPGNYSATFDASRFTSSVYFYRLQAGTFSDVKKLLLLK